jgi:hypothetical protein
MSNERTEVTGCEARWAGLGLAMLAGSPAQRQDQRIAGEICERVLRFAVNCADCPPGKVRLKSKP